MDESNYDEFGNYIGPDVDSEDDLIEDDNNEEEDDRIVISKFLIIQLRNY